MSIRRLDVVPDLIEPLVAYRAWRYEIVGGSVRFGAASFSASWDMRGAWEGAEGGWVVASCGFGGPHPAPDERCSCGFYALKSLDEAAFMFGAEARFQTGRGDGGGSNGDLASEGFVIGRVHLAGKVIEHAGGYRAERVRILELVPLGSDDGITGSVASRAGIPTADPYESAAFEAYAREFQASLEGSAETASSPPPRRRLTPAERLRLRTHQRRFRLIPGEGGSGPTA